MDASADLGAAASGAAQGTIDAFASGDLEPVAALRVAQCAPAQFQAVPGLIATSTAEPKASIGAATELGAAVGVP